jgi:hypothetical protein
MTISEGNPSLFNNVFKIASYWNFRSQVTEAFPLIGHYTVAGKSLSDHVEGCLQSYFELKQLLSLFKSQWQPSCYCSLYQAHQPHKKLGLDIGPPASAWRVYPAQNLTPQITIDISKQKRRSQTPCLKHISVGSLWTYCWLTVSGSILQKHGLNKWLNPPPASY